MLDTGVPQMSTSANEASWKVPHDLPLGKPLAVRVQVWDQYGAGSGWSESTWLYVNRAPVAAFDRVPKPAYEGDEVRSRTGPRIRTEMRCKLYGESSAPHMTRPVPDGMPLFRRYEPMGIRGTG